jgi:hypothetical protein
MSYLLVIMPQLMSNPIELQRMLGKFEKLFEDYLIVPLNLITVRGILGTKNYLKNSINTLVYFKNYLKF